MTVDELREKIWPCKKDEPFIFVSYKRSDAEKVYPLVIELQNKGVNIWIDKEMKGSVGKDWQKPAFDALYEYDCKAVLLFVSNNSLVSAPVLAELAYSKEGEVCDTHRGQALPIYPFDLENIVENYGSVLSYVQGMTKTLIKTKTDKAKMEDMFPKDKLTKFLTTSKLPDNNFQIAMGILRQADIEKEKTILAVTLDEIVETLKKDCPAVFNLEIKKADIIEPENGTTPNVTNPDTGKNGDEEQKVTVKPVVKVPEITGKPEKSLHDMLYAFMDKYSEQVQGSKAAVTDEEKEKYKPGKSNGMYNMVCSDIPEGITTAFSLDDSAYECDASVGAGKWAGCPWIAVFNRYITYSVTQGVYVVYLLNPETKELYLTLNQGETRFAKLAEEKGVAGIKALGYKKKEDYISALLKESTTQIRSEIETGNFSTELISSGKQGYDLGCICSKKYTLTDLPEDDVLLADLHEMLKIYNRYFELHADEYSSVQVAPKRDKKGGKTVLSADGTKVKDRGIF